MSTQQDIYAVGSESRPSMLNKENYVSWSSRLLRYDKSRPNRKLIHNSILNGPYVRRMIPEPGDANREITVTKTFHLQTDDELSDKELKQIEADDQAIQNILLNLPEYIYAAVDSCEPAQEIWFTSNEGELIESYYRHFLKLMNDLKRNKHFPEKIASNLKFMNNLQPEWSQHVTIVHQTKDLHTADYTQLIIYFGGFDPLSLDIGADNRPPPLIWPSVEVEGVTRLKKYSELSAAEAIQADCDVKATNIILQGLPPEVYALVSTHKITKELWERIQMLMQGTSLTKQEREC
nr:hypothetical protein [Tanacetum cinerariifolium]